MSVISWISSLGDPPENTISVGRYPICRSRVRGVVKPAYVKHGTARVLLEGRLYRADQFEYLCVPPNQISWVLCHPFDRLPSGAVVVSERAIIRASVHGAMKPGYRRPNGIGVFAKGQGSGGSVELENYEVLVVTDLEED